MITFTRLGRFGRLGNQLFQYALLKGVQAATGWTAKVPADGAPGFRLPEVFQIECPRLDERDVVQAEFQEPSFRFHPEVFEVGDGVDFVGYFQSQRYFAAVADELRRELRFLPVIAARADDALADLRRRHACLVSLHVRRGDYVGNDAHQVCGLDYYARARAALPEDALFVICSDDPAWCRQAFGGWPAWQCELDDATTLAVMSRCDHHVVAASTFSWWGAWLNPSPRKIVLAPRTWFGPAFAHLETCDLLPSAWRRLD